MSSIVRRAALRALSVRPTYVSSSASLVSPLRSQVSCAPSIWRLQQQWALSQFRRTFADETKPEAEASVTSEPTATPSSASEDVEPSARTEEAELSDLDEKVIEPSTLIEETVVETSAPAAKAEAVTDSAAAAADEFDVSDAPPQPARRNLPFGVIEPNRTLYFGNLFFESTEEDLKRFVEPYGDVESVMLKLDERGLSRGFAYVSFVDLQSATRALEACNQELFHGRRLTVQYHRKRPGWSPGPMSTPTSTLFIGNMSFQMSDKDLNDLFREIRNVRDVRVAIDRRSGQPRGFAHADFLDVESATAALNILRNKEIYGRPLRVDYSLTTRVDKDGRQYPRRSRRADARADFGDGASKPDGAV